MGINRNLSVINKKLIRSLKFESLHATNTIQSNCNIQTNKNYSFGTLKCTTWSNEATSINVLCDFNALLSRSKLYYLWLYNPFVAPWQLLQVHIPILIRYDSLGGGSARHKACSYTQDKNRCIQAITPRVQLEPTTPVFESTKTAHASDRAATVVGSCGYTHKIFSCESRRMAIQVSHTSPADLGSHCTRDEVIPRNTSSYPSRIIT